MKLKLSNMTELKKALQAKILEFEECKNDPKYNSEIERNAILVTLKQLKYLDSIAEIEQSDLNTGIVRGGDNKSQLVQRVEKYFKYPDLNQTPTTPTEPLPAEGSAKSVCGGKKLCECYDPFPDENNVCRNCNGSTIRA